MLAPVPNPVTWTLPKDVIDALKEISNLSSKLRGADKDSIAYDNLVVELHSRIGDLVRLLPNQEATEALFQSKASHSYTPTDQKTKTLEKVISLLDSDKTYFDMSLSHFGKQSLKKRADFLRKVKTEGTPDLERDAVEGLHVDLDIELVTKRISRSLLCEAVNVGWSMAVVAEVLSAIKVALNTPSSKMFIDPEGDFKLAEPVIELLVAGIVFYNSLKMLPYAKKGEEMLRNLSKLHKENSRLKLLSIATVVAAAGLTGFMNSTSPWVAMYGDKTDEGVDPLPSIFFFLKYSGLNLLRPVLGLLFAVTHHMMLHPAYISETFAYVSKNFREIAKWPFILNEGKSGDDVIPLGNFGTVVYYAALLSNYALLAVGIELRGLFNASSLQRLSKSMLHLEMSRNTGLGMTVIPTGEQGFFAGGNAAKLAKGLALLTCGVNVFKQLSLWIMFLMVLGAVTVPALLLQEMLTVDENGNNNYSDGIIVLGLISAFMYKFAGTLGPCIQKSITHAVVDDGIRSNPEYTAPPSRWDRVKDSLTGLPTNGYGHQRDVDGADGEERAGCCAKLSDCVSSMWSSFSPTQQPAAPRHEVQGFCRLS